MKVFTALLCLCMTARLINDYGAAGSGLVVFMWASFIAIWAYESEQS